MAAVERLGLTSDTRLSPRKRHSGETSRRTLAAVLGFSVVAHAEDDKKYTLLTAKKALTAAQSNICVKKREKN